MNDIRIAFFDVDGTLSNMKTGRISAKTLECMHRLQARGVRICIATGRGPCLVILSAAKDLATLDELRGRGFRLIMRVTV